MTWMQLCRSNEGRGGPHRACRPLPGLLCMSTAQNNSISITHAETSRAGPVGESAAQVRPLAHDHVVCLENNLDIKYPNWPRPPPHAADTRHTTTATTRLDSTLWLPVSHDCPATSWSILTCIFIVLDRYDISSSRAVPVTVSGRRKPVLTLVQSA